MILRNITNDEIENFSSLKDSGSPLKKTLISWLKDGITKLEWCFAIEEGDEFLGELIYGIFDNSLYILDINMKDLNIYDKLLVESLKVMKLQGFNEVQFNIYSDKKYFQKYVDLFLKIGFSITQKKESFVWNNSIINKLPKRLHFKSLKETGTENFINAIEKVTVKTLDHKDSDDVKKLGKKLSAKKYFDTLKDIDYNENFWQLAYTDDDKFAGLVIPSVLNNVAGAINYIGVIPEMRGHGYIDDLLIEGTSILKNNGALEVIGDIDEDNFPLHKALKRHNYKLSCRMFVMEMNF